VPLAIILIIVKLTASCTVSRSRRNGDFLKGVAVGGGEARKRLFIIGKGLRWGGLAQAALC
jgi:hypothetical protein